MSLSERRSRGAGDDQLYVFPGAAESGPARGAVEHEIGAALGALSRLDHDPSQVHSAALAACTPEEALQMFELIKDNFLLSQVFFELARETPAGRTAPPLHALNIVDLLRHTRLPDGDRLADCFTAINQIFQTIRNDPEAALFGFD